MNSDDSLFISILLYLCIFYYIFHCVIFSYDLIKENIIYKYFDRRKEDLIGFVEFDFIDEDEATPLSRQEIQMSLEKIRSFNSQKIKYKNVKIQPPKLINRLLKTEKNPEKTSTAKYFKLETIESESDDDIKYENNLSILYKNDNEEEKIEYI
jgi:hypothetical protein